MIVSNRIYVGVRAQRVPLFHLCKHTSRKRNADQISVRLPELLHGAKLGRELALYECAASSDRTQKIINKRRVDILLNIGYNARRKGCLQGCGRIPLTPIFGIYLVKIHTMPTTNY